MTDQYTTKQAAEELGLKQVTVNSLITNGFINAQKNESGRYLIPANEIKRLKKEYGYDGHDTIYTISMNQAHKQFNISAPTLRRMIDDGKLTARRHGNRIMLDPDEVGIMLDPKTVKTDGIGLDATTTMTPQEVADALGVNFTTVYAWNRQGVLEGHKNLNGHLVFRKEDVRGLHVARRGGERINRDSVHFGDKNQPQLMIAKQVADYMNVTPGTVSVWRRDGKLSCVNEANGKVYFDKKDVDAFKTKRDAKIDIIRGLNEDQLTTGRVADLLNINVNTAMAFADHGFLKAIRVPSITGYSQRIYDKKFLDRFMKFHGITAGNPENVVISRNGAFWRSANYVATTKNGVLFPEIHILTHEGYDLVDELGNVIESKTGLHTEEPAVTTGTTMGHKTKDLTSADDGWVMVEAKGHARKTKIIVRDVTKASRESQVSRVVKVSRDYATSLRKITDELAATGDLDVAIRVLQAIQSNDKLMNELVEDVISDHKDGKTVQVNA